MKKLLSLILLFSLVLGLFSGCGRSFDNSGYVPTGNAILMEDEEPEEDLGEEEDQ